MLLLLVLFSLASLLWAAAIPSSKDTFENSGDPNYVGEAGEYFEGDMMLTENQINEVMEAVHTKNGRLHSKYRWPQNTVVYHIVESDFSETEIKQLRLSMDYIEQSSCVKFRPKKGDEYAVVIKTSLNGCSASVGYNPEKGNSIKLHAYCFKVNGTLLHEMLHTLGFYHMQSTYNRDDYVSIHLENVQEGQEHNFFMHNKDTVTDFGVEYDYDSLMHYGRKAFSKNGEDTIVPLQDVEIGQRQRLSERDIQKLNSMYCKNNQL